MRTKVQMVSVDTKCVLSDAAGNKIFVKLRESGDPKIRRRVETQLVHEQTALEVVEGLAAPRALTLSAGDQRRLFAHPGTLHLAQTHVVGAWITYAKLSAHQTLGVWLFVAEQLAAFRKRGIIYSDIKTEHVIVSRPPLRVMIVDFGCTVVVNPSRRYVNDGICISFTPGFHAPEQLNVRRVHESSVVYQLCMLLGASLVGLDSSRFHDPKQGLAAFYRKLGSIGAQRIIPTIKAGLSTRPADRPRGYDALYEEMLDANRKGFLPASAVRTWRALRRPHVEALEALGFEL